MTHSIENRISFQITADQLQTSHTAVQTLMETLVPLLCNVDSEERRALPKMGAKTIDFVSKTLSYTRANPQFQPPFIDVDEFAIDLAAVGVLRDLLQPLTQIVDMLSDTLLLSGSEALMAALACYTSFKGAAKSNAPGAATIVQDLAARFAARSSKSTTKVPDPDDKK